MENNSAKYWSVKSRNFYAAALYKLGRRPPKPYYTKIISEIAEQMRPNVYLEIGIFQCVTFNEVSKYAKIAIGSDLEASSSNHFELPNQELILGDIDVVVEQLLKREIKPDLVFIDANHECDFVVRDFETIEPFLNRNALVVFHDTYPGSIEQTSQEFCGDAYLAVPKLRKKFGNYSFVTLPIHPGLTFSTKSSDMPIWTY